VAQTRACGLNQFGFAKGTGEGGCLSGHLSELCRSSSRLQGSIQAESGERTFTRYSAAHGYQLCSSNALKFGGGTCSGLSVVCSIVWRLNGRDDRRRPSSLRCLAPPLPLSRLAPLAQPQGAQLCATPPLESVALVQVGANWSSGREMGERKTWTWTVAVVLWRQQKQTFSPAANFNAKLRSHPNARTNRCRNKR